MRRTAAFSTPAPLEMTTLGQIRASLTAAVAEALVGPRKSGNREVAGRMLAAFRAPFVEVIPFGLEAAEHYASIRATQSISPPDAIHLACAAQAEIDLFLTNDKRLLGKVIPGIQFIAGIDSRIL
jgi:predicted nucleic acid-binding protein